MDTKEKMCDEWVKFCHENNLAWDMTPEDVLDFNVMSKEKSSYIKNFIRRFKEISN